jgi:hypothetical protein
MFDLNNDSRLNIADEYYLFARKAGVFNSWMDS